LLALVAIVALLPVYRINYQDRSRICLAQALAQARLYNDACLATSLDRATFGGHLYSDKAPGVSVLELPAAEAVRLPPMNELADPSPRLWAVRLLTSGIAFLLSVFMVGRVAEGLAPGWGGPSLVAFGLGTLAGPLAATSFEHVAVGTAGLAAFLLAWKRRALLAGLCAGGALLLEYQAVAIVVAVAIYLAVRERRKLPAYVAGVCPGLALLLAYDALAFGSPFHVPYRYVSNVFASDQAGGFFGVHLPRAHSIRDVFVGSEGLLVISPVLVAAAVGLVLLARRHRAEAIVAGAVTLFYVLLDSGYYLPYGGGSPGPRFLVPALPFIALGLGPAFARLPRVTALLSLVSVIATTGIMLVWNSDQPLRQTIWGELVRAVADGPHSKFLRVLMTANAIGWTSAGSGTGLVVIMAAAAGALVVALWRPLRPYLGRSSVLN
jgi:hypothetical protein